MRPIAKLQRAADIRAISFDLDDTLWPIEPVIAQAEQALYDWLQTHCPRVTELHSVESLRLQRDLVWQQNPELALRHDYSAARILSLRHILLPLGYVEAAVQAAYGAFIAARNTVQFYPDALNVLASLQSHFALLAISNGNADLARIGIAQRFSYCVSAREIGIAKPEPGIFLAACQAVQLLPAQVLHVGDHPEYDVQGARRAGLRSAWLNRSALPWPAARAALGLEASPEPEIELLQLSDLLPALGI
jgi:FMN hydrolase / 5-amino-6-(5-phospho-D-ribitylamino)uracil phosphatase